MDVTIVLFAVCVVAALVFARSSRSRDQAWPVPTPGPDAETRQTVSELVARGRKIEAIKALRSSTGLGLSEAKECIDTWDQNQGAAAPVAQASAQGPDSAELEALATETREVRHTSGEISAIKHVRERTGWGLVDAKRYVDQLT